MSGGHHFSARRALGSLPAWLLGVLVLVPATATAAGWSTYGGNAQHTAVSPVGAQPLDGIRWTTPVDLAPPSGSILIHYGSPLVTAANTVVVPVKTGNTEGYRVEARSGADGTLLWSQTSDYLLPAHNWTPSYSPALAGNRLYFPGAGGTVYFRDNVDSGAPTAVGQLAFYGLSNYLAAPSSFNATVFIDTPITVDSAGTIYFGFRTNGTAPLGLQSGIARIDANGNGTWIPAMNEFRPELVIFSAGFDAHAEDDMAMLRFTDADYAWVTGELKAVADRHAGGRMVSMLEGGYALSALGRSAVQHIKVMSGLS